MNTERFHNSLSPTEYAALIDAAKVRAMELRREAISDFWSAVARGARAAWHAIRRHGPTSRIGNQLEV